MPYFERKPWSAPQQPSSEPAQETAELDMVNMAQAILMAEADNPHMIEGPFRARHAAQLGSATYLVLQIENSDGDTPLNLDLSATDLRAKSGEMLPASAIEISPSQVSLSAGQSKPVKISLDVPASAKPALYSGRIKATGAEPTDFIVEFEVLSTN
jgi:uncharacterized membrane protein